MFSSHTYFEALFSTIEEGVRPPEHTTDFLLAIMVGDPIRTGSTAIQSPRQYFYNVCLVAYACAAKQSKYVQLRVRKSTKKNSVKVVPPVAPSAAEYDSTATDSDDKPRGLWVEMWLSTAANYRKKAKATSAPKEPSTRANEPLDKSITKGLCRCASYLYKESGLSSRTHCSDSSL